MSFQPTITENCECPKCFEKSEWKRPKVIVMEGTTIVDTKSAGGGMGAVAGVGRGQGGISVVYQGVTLSTVGTHTSSMAVAYFPPDEPAEYVNREKWTSAAKNAVSRAAEIVESIERMCEEGKPLGFFSNTDSDIQVAQKRYLEARDIIERLAKYEIELAVWEQSRICGRCGTAYITQSEHASATHRIKIPGPKFDYPGRERRCVCGSHVWMNAHMHFEKKLEEAYEPQSAICRKIQQLDTFLADGRRKLVTAELRAKSDSFLDRIKKKILPLDPEALREDVRAMEATAFRLEEQRKRELPEIELRVAKLKEERDNDLLFSLRRFCSKCHRAYIPKQP